MKKLISSFPACVALILLCIGVTPSANAVYTFTDLGTLDGRSSYALAINTHQVDYNQLLVRIYPDNINLTTQEPPPADEWSRELLWVEYPTDNRGSYFRCQWELSGGDASDCTTATNPNSFLDASTVSAGWVLGTAYLINDQGWFVGDAYNIKNVRHAFLWSDAAVTIIVAAVPEPSTYAMLLAGLGLIGFTARHKKEHNV